MHPFTVIKGNPVTLKAPPSTEFHVAVVHPDAQIMNRAQQYRPDMLIVFPEGTKGQKPSYALASFCPCGHAECNSITVMQISDEMLAGALSMAKEDLRKIPLTALRIP